MADHPYIYQGSPMDEYLAQVAPEERVQEDKSATRKRASIASTSSDRESLSTSTRGVLHKDDDGASHNGVRRRHGHRRSSAAISHQTSTRERASSSASSASNASAGSSSSSSRRSRKDSHRQHHHHNINKQRAHSGKSEAVSQIDVSERPHSADSRIKQQSQYHPQMHAARERLNLLLVSYLSAPHYSSLPVQDQESIDRETVNAFLLDERFPQQQQQQQSNEHATLSRNNITSVNAKNQLQQHVSSQPRLVITRRGQLLFLGICSVALLGPSWTGGGSYNADGALSLASYWPGGGAWSHFPWWSWTSASAFAKTAAPGVIALTSLTAALLARSAYNQSSSLTFTQYGPGNGNGNDGRGRGLHTADREQAQTMVIVLELEKLFSLCKKFIDECTRLDITLEKAFTVLRDLDQLAGLDDDDVDEVNDDHEVARSSSSVGDTSHDWNANQHQHQHSHQHHLANQGNWQDLSSIEARLSSSHPRNPLGTAKSTADTRPAERPRRMKPRLPALDVRRAIFASLYAVQEHLERDLDTLAPTPAESSTQDRQERAGEHRQEDRKNSEQNNADSALDVSDIDIDRQELVRLLEMYSCFPPSSSYVGSRATQQSQHGATAMPAAQGGVNNTSPRRDTVLGQHEEEEADELYRRTMARRSLSPTLYSEQQGLARFNTSNANKRRSGALSAQQNPMHATHIFSDRAASEQPSISSAPLTAGVASSSHLDEQGNRRASWGAFGAEQRRLPQHRHAPSSPSSALPKLNTSANSVNPAGRARYSMGSSIPIGSAALTPPRARQRPQSIHFGVSHSAAVTSSPLASGALESNSTIKRERRRRSEQFFSLQSLQQSRLGEGDIGPDEHGAQSALRSSTCSSASIDSTASSSASASSAAMRMSISSEGTSADPVTAASSLLNEHNAFASPSRPGYIRQTSTGVLEQSNPTKAYKRRTRPLSMHELDFGRNSYRTQSERAVSPLENLPELNSTASHRNAAAAALEKRWSGVSYQSHFHLKNKERPASLLLQSSPILTSPPARERVALSSDSPAPSIRSMYSQYAKVKPSKAPSKFGLSALRRKSELVSTLEKAFVCHLLALRYSTGLTPTTSRHNEGMEQLKQILKALAAMVDGLNATVHTETTRLTQAMWEEFEGVPGPAASAVDPQSRFTAAQASVLLATPMTGNTALHSTPKRNSFVACIPGSYPSSPVIEVDPATPPSDTSARHVNDDADPVRKLLNDQRETAPDFAPRNPFSPAEQGGRDALTRSHALFSATLRGIATKLYLEKQDLAQYYDQPGTDQFHLVQQMESRHDSLRADLTNLYKLWDDGRAPIRQIRTGLHQRTNGRPNGVLAERSASLEIEDDDEPSLVTASAEISKQESFSSVASSGNEDSVTTPALSPTSQAISQPNNISDLLLDNTDPRALPRYGLQEQLFEAYVGSDSAAGRYPQQGKGKLSREERIAQAKADRQQRQKSSNIGQLDDSTPLANAELISELKDMVALLRSRSTTLPTREDA